MSPDRIFQQAVHHAKTRADWLRYADEARPSSVFSRRACLLRARWQEHAIIDLAIQAERDGPPPGGGGSPDTSPVPKIGATS